MYKLYSAIGTWINMQFYVIPAFEKKKTKEKQLRRKCLSIEQKIICYRLLFLMAIIANLWSLNNDIRGTWRCSSYIIHTSRLIFNLCVLCSTAIMMRGVKWLDLITTPYFDEAVTFWSMVTPPPLAIICNGQWQMEFPRTERSSTKLIDGFLAAVCCWNAVYGSDKLRWYIKTVKRLNGVNVLPAYADH